MSGFFEYRLSELESIDLPSLAERMWRSGDYRICVNVGGVS